MRRSHLGWRHGYTLTEIMIVVGIIGLLLTLCYPWIKGSIARAKKGLCITHLQTLDHATERFLLANGRLPAANAELAPEFIKTVPRCPAGGVYSVGNGKDPPECSRKDLGHLYPE
jgi:prepilin-type N-terminal cleavage/methylation domain-containing protein